MKVYVISVGVPTLEALFSSPSLPKNFKLIYDVILIYQSSSLRQALPIPNISANVPGHFCLSNRWWRSKLDKSDKKLLEVEYYNNLSMLLNTICTTRRNIRI